MSVVIMSIYVSNQLCGNIMSAYILGRGCLCVLARACVCVCVLGEGSRMSEMRNKYNFKVNHFQMPQLANCLKQHQWQILKNYITI